MPPSIGFLSAYPPTHLGVSSLQRVLVQPALAASTAAQPGRVAHEVVWSSVASRCRELVATIQTAAS